MEELLNNLIARFNQLEYLFYNHKHTQLDKSQKLSSTGNFAKGQATLVSGHVVVTDDLCTTSSRIMAIHDTTVTPGLVGVLTTLPGTGSFDIYSWKENTNGIIQTSDNGLIDYVIFY